MALSFPLSRDDFQNRLRIASVTPFRLQKFEETSGTGSGQMIVAQVAPPKWIAQIALSKMPFSEAAEVLALLDALGSTNIVHLYDPSVPYPKSDRQGTVLGNSSPLVTAIGVNNRSIRIGGLPPDYVLSVGDMIGINYQSASRRSLHRIVERAVASSGGITPMFEVRPTLPVGIAVGNVAQLAQPYGKFVITSFDPGTAGGLHVTGVRFSALQVPG